MALSFPKQLTSIIALTRERDALPNTIIAACSSQLMIFRNHLTRVDIRITYKRLVRGQVQGVLDFPVAVGGLQVRALRMSATARNSAQAEGTSRRRGCTFLSTTPQAVDALAAQLCCLWIQHRKLEPRTHKHTHKHTHLHGGDFSFVSFLHLEHLLLIVQISSFELGHSLLRRGAAAPFFRVTKTG